MSHKLLIFLILTSFSLPTLAGESLDSLLSAYSRLQIALAADNFVQAKQASQQMNQAREKIHGDHLPEPQKQAWLQQEKQLSSSLQEVVNANDLTTLRKQFAPLSQVVIALWKAAGVSGFQEFRCPMALNNQGANWLQKEEVTANPYFGSAMLRCGAVVKNHKGHEGHEHH